MRSKIVRGGGATVISKTEKNTRIEKWQRKFEKLAESYRAIDIYIERKRES